MDVKKPKFITTTFADTAEQMKQQGFVMVSHSGNVWTFLNSGTPQLFDYQKIAFTDRINL